MSYSAGIHRISAGEYHDDRMTPQPALSASIAKILLEESPRKAWYSHRRLNKDYIEEQDDKFDVGRASHSVLLENDASKIVVIDPQKYPSQKGAIPDGWTNKAIRAARDEARAAGKTPLLDRHYDQVRIMVDTALAFIEDSEIAEEWHAADAEVTGIWCEGTAKPIWLKCRFDKLAARRCWIGDYKTTEAGVAPESFSRFLVRMGYHIQDAFYRRGARALGIDAPEFTFLAQSCVPPYECSLHACHPGLLEIAEAEVERAIGIWRTCLHANDWPSYGGRIHYAMPTSYMIQEHEMRLAEAA